MSYDTARLEAARNEIAKLCDEPDVMGVIAACDDETRDEGASVTVCSTDPDAARRRLPVSLDGFRVDVILSAPNRSGNDFRGRPIEKT